MALTKHQKLARAMKNLLEDLEGHFQKTASNLNALQFHFYETHLIIGRPQMTEITLQTMMRTHKYAMMLLAPDPKMRSAAQNYPLIGCILTPRFYLRSQTYILPPDAPSSNEKSTIPWGVKTIFPQESLQKLEERKLEATLYCASKSEMSEWIDWFEHEDKANTLTNQLLAIENYYEQREPIRKNLLKQALPSFKQAVLEFYKKIQFPKVFKTLLKAEFAPKKNDDVGIAYQLVSESLAKHNQRNFEEFQRFWRDRLTDLMFEGTSWEKESRTAFLAEYFPSNNKASRKHSKSRWETGSALDRQHYGAFILYFAERFIRNPSKFRVEGEIALLLWIMIYASRDLERPTAIKTLLAITTENISDRYARIEGEEVEFSLGLAYMIKEYAGEGNLQRQQKLFPNLTQDKLEDYFHRASKAILPPGSLAALPEAFLTFPHPQKNVRMRAKLRRLEMENPPKVYHDTVSLKELKRQLVEKSKPLTS
jgi:hypothetical protein